MLIDMWSRFSSGDRMLNRKPNQGEAFQSAYFVKEQGPESRPAFRRRGPKLCQGTKGVGRYDVHPLA